MQKNSAHLTSGNDDSTDKRGGRPDAYLSTTFIGSRLDRAPGTKERPAPSPYAHLFRPYVWRAKERRLQAAAS